MMTNDKANEVATIIKELIYCMIMEADDKHSLAVRLVAAKEIRDSYNELVSALENIQCKAPKPALLSKHTLRAVTSEKDSLGITYM